MKKELKDYLHFYLGCEVKYLMNGKGVLSEISLDSKYGVLVSVKLNGSHKHIQTVISNIKPILRPLSDMTGDELVQYGKIEFPDMKGSFDLKGIREVAMHAYYEPETFKWLLSKHFDLFGLIESGLAIDKTTLK